MKTSNTCKIAMKMKLWWYIQFLTLINAHYSDFEKKKSGVCGKRFFYPPPEWVDWFLARVMECPTLVRMICVSSKLAHGNMLFLQFKSVSAESKNGELDLAPPGFNFFCSNFMTRMRMGPWSCVPNFETIDSIIRSQLTKEPLSTSRIRTRLFWSEFLVECPLSWGAS
jgi:hypothetical protein